MDINTTNSIKFSVSICVYKNDNPEHFDKALDSIINQTTRPDEIILVVDGPIPNTIQNVISKHELTAPLKTIRLPENLGHGSARRIGLSNCSNELVAIMDADDISLPDRFEQQIICFEKYPDLSIVGGNIEEFINSTDNVVGVREVPSSDISIKEYLKKRCPFNQMTVMFKKSDVEKVGGYQDWYNNEDYYLWIRMYQKGCKFMNLNKILVSVRVGEDMYRRRGGMRYFKSEAKLQKYMIDEKIIGVNRYVYNVMIRFIVQVIVPDRVRGFIFKKFARKTTSKCI